MEGIKRLEKKRKTTTILQPDACKPYKHLQAKYSKPQQVVVALYEYLAMT